MDPTTGQHRRFAYGSLPLYVIKATAHVATVVTKQPFYDYDRLPLLARLLSALADLGTIVLVFLLGRRLYGSLVGLLGAAFITFAVIHIQLSHFFAFDIFLTFFIVATVYFAARIVTKGGRLNAVLTGAFFAAALATKISVAPLGLAILVAYLLPHLHRHFEGTSSLGSLLSSSNRQHLRQTLINLSLTLGVAAVVFALFEPYAIMDPRPFLYDLSEQSGMAVRGLLDYPYTRQYVNTIPFVYQLKNLTLWGAGLPLGIGLVVALGGFVITNVRRPRKEDLLVMSWVIPYFLITGSFEVKFLRYMLPLVPFLCLMLAALLWRWHQGWRRAPASSAAVSVQKGPSSSSRNRGKWPAMAVTAVLLVSTAAWSLAFVSIYSRPHSRVEASSWIYSAVPRGAALGVETWDDPLPLSLSPQQSPSAYDYRFVSMGMYDDLPPEEKFSYIEGLLNQCDYIVLSSNRLYGSIPRLPWRYPVTIEYYQLLFQGKLGFQLAGTFTSYPSLLGQPIVDDGSDESFTVYDHPKVLIFKKTRSLSDAELRDLFTSALAQPATVTRYPSEKSLLLNQPVDQLPIIDDYAWNPLANASPVLAVLLWYVAVQVLALVAWPIAHQVFGGLRDRGYGLAKVLGILLLAYIVWLAVSLHLTYFTVAAIFFGLLALAVPAFYLTVGQRTALLSFLQENRRLTLIHEAVFAAAFAFFIGIRFLNPDLWQPWFGGEKPMEFAFLNAILRSPTLPPYDPWFAGGYINYYYFGQFIVAVLVKLVGVAPRVAFNLAVPTLFALTFLGVYSLGYNFIAARAIKSERFPVRRAAAWGLAAASLVAVAGNLDGLLQLWEIVGRALAGHGLAAFDFWRSTRVIPGTINEFPFFTFLFADLHAHMVSFPITIVAIGLALNVLIGRPADGPEKPSENGLGGTVRGIAALTGSGPAVGLVLLNLLIFAIVLGALAVTNSWDFPTYLLILLAAMALVALKRGTLRQRLLRLAVVGTAGGVVAAASLGLYWPFFYYFKSFYSSVALEHSHTDVRYFVVVYGFFLFGIVSYLVHTLARRPSSRGRLWPRQSSLKRPARGFFGPSEALSSRLQPLATPTGASSRFAAGGRLLQTDETLAVEPAGLGEVAASAQLEMPLGKTGAVPRLGSGRLLLIVLAVLAAGGLGFLTLRGLFIAGFLGILLILILLAAALRSSDNGERFVLLILFAGLAVAMGVELFYLVDFLQGGDWHRMNTVFKFYNQAWVLLGLGSALSLSLLSERMRRVFASRRPFSLRLAASLWGGVLIVLILSVAIYPIFGTNARVHDRFPGEGLAYSLDGLAYMQTGKLTMADGREISLRGDYDAIQWLLTNVKGTPVILEASIGPYRGNGSRIANNTGFPTPLGWDNHESQQRYPQEIAPRVAGVRTIYNTADIDLAMRLIRQYRVRYVYVGQIERHTVLDLGQLGATTKWEPYASTAGLAKFDKAVGQYFDVAYSNGDVKIYRVRG